MRKKFTIRLGLLATAVVAAVLVVGGAALAAMIEGDPNDNTLQGTVGADAIYGNGGNDTIYGLGGNDELDGGEGNDTIYGGNEYYSVAGDDWVVGRVGNDVLVGGPGRDILHGGPGSDVLHEGPRNDGVVDRINGAYDDDRIYAASGKDAPDIIVCSEGRDEVWVDSVDDVAAHCEVVHKDPAVAAVTFTKPLGVEEAVRIAQQNESDIAILEGDFKVGATPVHDFYMSPSETSTATSMEQDYEESRLGYFQDTVNDIEAMKSEDRSELQPMVDAMKAALARNDAGATTVNKATLSGDLEDLRALANGNGALTESGEDLVESVGVMNMNDLQAAAHEEATSDGQVSTEGPNDDQIMGTDGFNEEAPPSTDGTTDSDGTVTTEAGTWYPNVGYFKVKQSWRISGHRYSGQFFRWRNDTLTAADTYEHDVFIDNRDSKTYLTRRNGWYPLCLPYRVYGTTTLPSAAVNYFDTNFNGIHCQPKFRAYTIGVLHAEHIRSQVWYHTYVRTPNGNAGGDGAVLQAQNGYRWGCGSYSPSYPQYCSFSDGFRNLLGYLSDGNGRFIGVPTSWWKWYE
jgi:hypothetical protein